MVTVGRMVLDAYIDLGSVAEVDSDSVPSGVRQVNLHARAGCLNCIDDLGGARLSGGASKATEDCAAESNPANERCGLCRPTNDVATSNVIARRSCKVQAKSLSPCVSGSGGVQSQVPSETAVRGTPVGCRLSQAFNE